MVNIIKSKTIKSDGFVFQMREETKEKSNCDSCNIYFDCANKVDPFIDGCRVEYIPGTNYQKGVINHVCNI